MIVVPLTTIKLQLEADCQKLGFSALVGDQVLHDGLGNVHHLRPSVLIVSAEFLASTEVLSKKLPGFLKTNNKAA